jgi:hypothetical protein
MVATATEFKPLTAAEQHTLQDLLARSSAGQAPGVRIGDPYQAVTNISLPRRGDPTHQTDLVLAGDTLYLTPDEAQQLLRHGARDGRKIPVIRPKNEMGEPLPRILPKQVSGSLRAPPPPQPGSDMPRPDPPGSSAVLIQEDADIPEAHEPEAGSERDFPPDPDAEDIPPRRSRSRPGAGAR